MRIMFFLVIVFNLCTAFAVETEISGNLEGQVRNSTNNPVAKEAPLFQDWDQENFYLVYGNLHGKVEFGESRIEANWFARYSESNLYDPAPLGPFERDPYFATKIFTFPNRLVARDIFQMQHIEQSGTHQTESILNKFYYEWDDEDQRFMLGRLYVNYGLGEIFNPINPFNQPTALTSTSQVAQGNDGVSFTFFVKDNHMIQFLFLGDKRIENYDGAINRTLWIHGELQPTDKLQIDYVLGEDQSRNKIGSQVSYQFEESLMFFQFLYQTELITPEASVHLWDVLVGYDRQLTSKWHLRFEGGYQKQDDYANPGTFTRFLPTEYFAALANVYEVHPLVKVSGTLVNDIKSGFSYLIAKGTYSITKSTEVEAFGFSPISKGDSTDNLAQKLVTTDIGISLRTFF
jgi:hypothetical protein